MNCPKCGKEIPPNQDQCSDCESAPAPLESAVVEDFSEDHTLLVQDGHDLPDVGETVLIGTPDESDETILDFGGNHGLASGR